MKIDFASTRSIDHNRRRLVFGNSAELSVPNYPPWTTEDRILGACTRCDACIYGCPEGVLKTGQGGFPEFDPRTGSGICTFCGACVAVCPEEVFDQTLSPPWSLKAYIENINCLAGAGIHCSSCTDICDDNAIQMAARIGGPPIPKIITDKCSGCGACIGVCPGSAVSIESAEQMGTAA